MIQQRGYVVFDRDPRLGLTFVISLLRRRMCLARWSAPFWLAKDTHAKEKPLLVIGACPVALHLPAGTATADTASSGPTPGPARSATASRTNSAWTTSWTVFFSSRFWPGRAGSSGDCRRPRPCSTPRKALTWYANLVSDAFRSWS